MSCIINNGHVLTCSSIGGVEKVWIGTYSASATYQRDASDVITGVTSASTVYLFQQDMESAGLTQPGVYSDNGTVHYVSSLTMKFVDLTSTLRNTILALGKAPIVAFVKANSGVVFALGTQSAGRAKQGEISVGVKMDDLNGATVTIEFKSQSGASVINESLIGTSITVG